MRVLLDTHTLLWFIEADPLLSARARDVIERPDTNVFLSMASAWEIVIKVRIGKIVLRDTLATLIVQQQRNSGLILLPILMEHLAPLATLPLHHRDPFDRLLIVQAMVENMPIVSVDATFDAYDVLRIW